MIARLAVLALALLLTVSAAHAKPKKAPAPPRIFKTLTVAAPCDTGLALYRGKLHWYTLRCDSIYQLLGPVKR